MEKIKKEHKSSKNKDLLAENVSKLKSLFPEIISEDKIDFESLKNILSDNIEHNDEYYRFNWAGKGSASNEGHKLSSGTLRPDLDESLDWNTTQNLYIEGDNLEVFPTSYIYNKKPDYLLILAWLHADKIIDDHHRFIDEGGSFLRLFPGVDVVK